MSHDEIVCNACRSQLTVATMKLRPSGSVSGVIGIGAQLYRDAIEILSRVYECSHGHSTWVCNKCDFKMNKVRLQHVAYCYLKQAIETFNTSDGIEITAKSGQSCVYVDSDKGCAVFDISAIMFHSERRLSIYWYTNKDKLFWLVYSHLFCNIPQLLFMIVDYVDLILEIMQIPGIENTSTDQTMPEILEKITSGTFKCISCGKFYDGFPTYHAAKEHYMKCNVPT